MKAGLTTAAIAEVAIISYRSIKQGKQPDDRPLPLPMPSDYVAVIVIFGALGLLPESANSFTTVFGWGLVVATLLNLWNPPTLLAPNASVKPKAQAPPAQPTG